MLKYRAVMLTVSVFLLWWVLGLGTDLLTRQMIDSIRTSNTSITVGSMVYTISLIELVLRLIGTYLIAQYFLNQSTEKTERFE